MDSGKGFSYCGHTYTTFYAIKPNADNDSIFFTKLHIHMGKGYEQ